MIEDTYSNGKLATAVGMRFKELGVYLTIISSSSSVYAVFNTVEN